MKIKKISFVFSIVCILFVGIASAGLVHRDQWLDSLPTNNYMYTDTNNYLYGNTSNYRIDCSTNFYVTGGLEVAGDIEVIGTVTFTGAIAASSMTATNTVSGGILTDGTATIEAGSIVCSDINTGQGVTEVFAMDQDVETTDEVVFSSASLTGNLWVAGTSEQIGSITTQSSFVIGSADLDETDLEKLDGITDGTAAANKAVVLDGSLNVTTINSLTATTVVGTNFTIGANTLTTTEFAFLDGQDQAVTTTDDVTFSTVTATGDIWGADDIAGVSFTIGANSLSTTEWAFLDAIDQSVATTDDVTFSTVTATGDIWGADDVAGQSFTIGANSLTTTEWAFLDGQDQAVATADDVVFKKLSLTGDFNLDSFVTMTDTGTVTISSATVILATKAGAMAITLPDAATSAGKIFTVKKTDSNASIVSIDASGGTIDGADPYTEIDAQYDFVTIISDGTNWHIVGKYITP